MKQAISRLGEILKKERRHPFVDGLLDLPASYVSEWFGSDEERASERVVGSPYQRTLPYQCGLFLSILPHFFIVSVGELAKDSYRLGRYIARRGK